MHHHILRILAASAVLAGSCSFLLDTEAIQCHGDEDCRAHGATICDVAAGVCVPVVDASTGDGAGSDGGDPSCVGPGGCFSCEPTTLAEIVSHCTDALCVPFDNARLSLLGESGGLRPLP